jgi:hypothetical protein
MISRFSTRIVQTDLVPQGFERFDRRRPRSAGEAAGSTISCAQFLRDENVIVLLRVEPHQVWTENTLRPLIPPGLAIVPLVLLFARGFLTFPKGAMGRYGTFFREEFASSPVLGNR